MSGAGRELQSREMAATVLFYFDDFRMDAGCLEVNQRQAKFKYYIEERFERMIDLRLLATLGYNKSEK